MRLEEFGVDLFACIKLFGQRAQVRRVKAWDLYVGRTDRLSEWNHQDDQLTEQIVQLFARLSPHDQQRLMAQFEREAQAAQV